jgi:Zn-dependent protease with chaperone function
LIGRAKTSLKQRRPDRAIDDYSTALAISPNDAEALRARAGLLLRLGDAHGALFDVRRALALNPRDIRARVLEEQALQNQGELIAFPFSDSPLDLVFATTDIIANYEIAVASIIGCALAVIGNFRIGWRQKVEGGGSIARWLSVCTVVTLGCLSPLVIYTLLATGGRHDVTHVPFVLGFAVLGAVYGAVTLGPPLRVPGTKDPQPLVDDSQFLARLSEVSARLGVRPTPRARLLRTAGGQLQTMAWAGGIVAPSVYVTDGVMHRLRPEERDAIVAHELSHIANGSLWWYAAVMPVALTVATVLMPYYGALFAVLFGLAFWVGAKRIVSRCLEFDCDRRAANALGYCAMSSALAKVHAVSAVRTVGVRALLVYATATHPSLNMRLAALGRVAPADDRPDFDDALRQSRPHELASRTALFAWAGILALSLALGPFPTARWFGLAMLWLVTVTPLLLLLAGVKPQYRRDQRRAGQNLTFRQFALTTVVCAVALMGILWFERSELTVEFMAPLSLAVCVVTVLAGRSLSQQLDVRNKIAAAAAARDFERVVELARLHPRQVARRADLRCAVAMSAALTGDRPGAISELERLVVDRPKYAVGHHALFEFLLDAGDVGRAIQVAEQAAGRFPTDPVFQVQLARALRTQGRLDAAQAAVERAMQLEPDEAGAFAAATAIALDRGETNLARAHIQRALALSPGDPYALIRLADLVLKTGDDAAAYAAVKEAAAAIRANPFFVMASEAPRLEAALADKLHESVAEPEIVS